MKPLAVAALLGLTGCGSIQDLSSDAWTKACFGPSPSPHVFGGVRMDAYLCTAGGHISFGYLNLIDVPFSLVLDSVLLPVSIPVALFYSPDPKNDLEVPK